MKGYKWCGMVVAALVLGLVAAAAQKAQKIDRYATIEAESWTYNWAKKVHTFEGNVTVELLGPDRATMRSSKMTGKVAKGASAIGEIIAQGPVTFDITTRHDDKGVRQHIVARCAGEGKYVAGTKVIVLTGGAEGQISSIPADPNIEPHKFSGGTVTINLKTFDVKVEGGIHATIQLPREQPEENTE